MLQAVASILTKSLEANQLSQTVLDDSMVIMECIGRTAGHAGTTRQRLRQLSGSDWTGQIQEAAGRYTMMYVCQNLPSDYTSEMEFVCRGAMLVDTYAIDHYCMCVSGSIPEIGLVSERRRQIL